MRSTNFMLSLVLSLVIIGEFFTPAFGQEVNVFSYGAVGDGVVDDTLAFQAAFNTGQTVWVPGQHTYLLNGLTLVSGMTLDCEDWTAILKLRNNATGLVRSGWLQNDDTAPAVSNIIIRNCQFDGNKANNTDGVALKISGNNIVVEHNYIHDTNKACVDMGRGDSNNTGMWVLNNWCHNPAASGNQWGAFAFTSGSAGYMINNLATTADNFMAYCYDIEPNPHWATGPGFYIIGNQCQMNGTTVFSGGIQISGQDSAVISDTIVSQNIVTLHAGNCIVYRFVNELTIEDNICVGGTAGGIVEGSSGVVTGLKILNNMIVNPGKQGITYTEIAPAQFIGNTIRNAGTVVSAAGNAFQISNMVGGILSANTITGSLNEGILLGSVSKTAIIGNNVNTGALRGLRMGGIGCGSLTVIGNTFSDNLSYGIWEADMNCDYNFFIQNDLQNNTAGPYLIHGPHDQIF